MRPICLEADDSGVRGMEYDLGALFEFRDPLGSCLNSVGFVREAVKARVGKNVLLEVGQVVLSILGRPCTLWSL